MVKVCFTFRDNSVVCSENGGDNWVKGSTAEALQDLPMPISSTEQLSAESPSAALAAAAAAEGLRESNEKGMLQSLSDRVHLIMQAWGGDAASTAAVAQQVSRFGTYSVNDFKKSAGLLPDPQPTVEPDRSAEIASERR